jgi:hypothetical protein
MAVDPTKLPPPNPEIGERALAALNRLCKWRTVLTGWQLGTRTTQDPEAQAVRDHRDQTMLLRAEVSALVALLISKGTFDGNEWAEQLREEADQLSTAYAAKFPGFVATDDGIDMFMPEAAETMKGWRP